MLSFNFVRENYLNMKTNRLFHIIFLFFVLPFGALAQPYCSVRTFNIRDGLAANIISSLDQTADDMMWFATWNGLCCFDGYKFTTFRDIPGKTEVLTTNRMLKLGATAEGDLWCITYDRRLDFFDTRRCEFVDKTSMLEKKYPGVEFSFRYIYSLDNGCTWAVTDGKNPMGVRFDDRTKSDDDVRVLRDRAITAVRLDNDSTEWVFSKQGTFQWGGKVRSARPYSLMSQVGRRVFFATRDARLGYYQKGGRKIVDVGMPADVDSITCLRPLGGHELAIGTDKGILVCNTATLKMTRLSVQHPGQPTSYVKYIFVDSRRRIWALTGGSGVIMIDRAQGTTSWLTAQAATPTERTTSLTPFIYEDKNHTLWMVPADGTFAYYDENERRLVPYVLRSTGFTYANLPQIKKYFIDAQGNLWFGGQHDLTVVNFKFRRINLVPLQREAEVRAVTFDRSGRLWVGDNRECLSLWDASNHCLGFMDKEGRMHPGVTPFSARPYGMTEDRRGRMWIATKGGGVFVYDHGQMRHYVHDASNPYSLSHNDVYDIREDRRGRIWVATFGGGINLLDEQRADGRFYNKNNTKALDFNGNFLKVRRIIDNGHGVMIFSTSDGLMTCSEDFGDVRKIKFFVTDHIRGNSSSLAASDVLQTFVSHKDTIYVMTLGGGFQKIVSENLLQDSLRLQRIPVDNTPEGAFQSMAEDRQGRLWLVRENTLDMYDPAKGQLLSYGDNELEERIEFSEARPAYDSRTDRMAMGYVGGFINFAPRRLKKSSYKPKIAFVSVQYQGEDEAHPILKADELDVPSDKRNLTISFAALDYASNELIRYAYKLEGVDEKWNYVGAAHSASFNDLPHGRHRLLVRSTNSDGVWMDNQAALSIYAHPSFWESAWGWLFYILVGCAIIYVAVYISNLQRRNKMEMEMNEMKTNFFTNIGHKLRTPLTLIGGPISEVLRRGRLDHEDRESLEMVQRNSRSMLELVNNMLKYNKDDKNFIVDDESAPVFARQAEDEAPDTGGPRKDITILVVEDNDDLRSFLTHILKSDYNVITAPNGKVGLEKATTSMPDFIISDVMMPEMDGLTMIHHIKANKDTCHIPIIVLSAKASLGDRLQGLKEGIDDYITKPFSAIYLKQRVENIISQRHALQQTYLEQIKIEDGQENFKIQSPEIVDADKEMMEKLMNYLEEHIGDTELKVDDLAGTVNLGRTVFYGKMKSIVGMAPVDFVRHIRMQRAEELVTKSKLTFSQIAYSVGYSDPKYFSKCFKKETGMTPSEYRQIHRR